MTNIYKIGLAFIQDNCLLLCKPLAFDDLILPGGVKENNENPAENLAREVQEELGIEAFLDKSSLKYLGQFSDKAAGKTDRVVEVELYLGSVIGNLSASSEIKELIWFNPSKPNIEKLSAVVKNKVIPHLIEIGLLKNQ